MKEAAKYGCIKTVLLYSGTSPTQILSVCFDNLASQLGRQLHVKPRHCVVPPLTPVQFFGHPQSAACQPLIVNYCTHMFLSLREVLDVLNP